MKVNRAEDLVVQIMQDIGLRENPEYYSGKSFNRLKRNDAIRRLKMVLLQYNQRGYPVLPLQPGIKELLLRVSASESVKTLNKTWGAIYDAILVHIELVVQDGYQQGEALEYVLAGLRKFLTNLANE